MEELGQLERHDRQRRQEAVAKIPVRFLFSSSQLKGFFLLKTSCTVNVLIMDTSIRCLMLQIKIKFVVKIF